MKLQHQINILLISFLLLSCGKEEQKTLPKDASQPTEKQSAAIASPDLGAKSIDNQKSTSSLPGSLPGEKEKPAAPQITSTQPKIDSSGNSEKKSLCQGSGETKWNDCIGTLSLPNGYSYVGEWVDGKQNGRGSASLPNGFKYVGEFKNNKFSGQGNATLPNGGSYVGEFKDGNYAGKGTLTFPDGTKHTGEFVAGIPNGYGNLLFPNGDKYEGGFKDGKYSGKGTFYFAKSQESKRGLWSDGKLVLAD